MMISPAPDLLRRFVDTPHKITCLIHGRVVSIESNGLDLVECFAPVSQQIKGNASWTCKIVRDAETSAAAMEWETFGHDSLEVKCLESGSQLVIDHETRELLVFVARNDSGRLIAESISSAFEGVV